MSRKRVVMRLYCPSCGDVRGSTVPLVRPTVLILKHSRATGGGTETCPGGTADTAADAAP